MNEGVTKETRWGSQENREMVSLKKQKRKRKEKKEKKVACAQKYKLMPIFLFFLSFFLSQTLNVFFKCLIFDCDLGFEKQVTEVTQIFPLIPNFSFFI